MLDPILTFVVDVLWSNFDCSSRRGCEEDVTASSCSCVTGDAFKILEWYQREEDSGLVGVVIVAVVYVTCASMSTD